MRRVWMRWGALRALALVLVGGLALSASNAGSPAGPLWISESNGLLNIATDSGQIRIKIPISLGIAALAINDVDGSIWAYGKKTLHHYTRNGEFVVKVDTPIDTHGSDPQDMIADGWGGNLWMGIQGSLYRFDLQGNYQQEILATENIVGLALDREQSILWVAQAHRIDRYDQDGTALAPILASAAESFTDVAFDRRLGRFWVGLVGGLRQYDVTGQAVAEIPGLQGGSIAPDGAGGIWIASNRTLRHLGPSGDQDFFAEPFSADPNKEIVDLAADPGDASVWIASKRGIRHIAVDGATVNTIYPQQVDGIIRKLYRANLYADLDPPQIAIVQPTDGALLGNSRPDIMIEYADLGVGIDQASIAVKVNGLNLAVACTTTNSGATCLPQEDFPEGLVSLSATIADTAGNRSEPTQIEITIDTMAPTINIVEPAPDSLTNQAALIIRGALSEPAQLTINGASVEVSASQTFSAEVQLVEGVNIFTLHATDSIGNSASNSLTVTLDTLLPGAPVSEKISISDPLDGRVTVTGTSGSVEGRARVEITNSRTGQTIVVVAADDGSFLAQIDAEAGDVLQIRVVDGAGNSSEQSDFTVANGLPPDPAIVAPPLTESGHTPFHEATAFLYSGDNPIQTGVAPGTISPLQAAVIRGRVTDDAGAPLPGVTISINGRPEFGETLSRADGMFDLAVNGGSHLTIDYLKKDFLPLQRQVRAPWRDFVPVRDVTLIPRDSQVTQIQTNAPNMQVAQGSVQTDDDGSRQATLLFPAGTQASYVRPDGTQQSLTSMSVRATEYTVGPNGPARMPGPLPPTSAYTYAVEISVDEVVADGVKVAGKDVIFNQQFPLYVDNFLGFPIGMLVPTGYYDADAAAWIPSENGLVVQILSINADGLAELDTDGSGSVANAEVLTGLGITDAERATLATLYAPGKSVWRMPLNHFSTYDCNLPAELPDGAESAAQPEPLLDEQINDPDTGCGSIVECQNQVIRETVDVIGTPFTLNYRSDRVPGRRAAYQLDIALSGETIPTVLAGIELEIELNGRVQYLNFPAAPNQRHLLEWDGRDVYGRRVTGSTPVRITINYLYNGVYQFPRDVARSFGFPGTTPFVEVPARQVLRLGQSFYATLGTLDSRMQGLGGWTLSPVHGYDVNARVLHQGNGERRSANDVTLVASTEVFGVLPQGQGSLNAPRNPVVAADGSIYFADTNNSCVRRQLPDDSIETVAGICGRNSGGFSGDGGLATAAQLFVPQDVAVHSDGSVYIVDSFNNRIRKVDPDGFIETVAGNGGTGFSGDGGPAVNAAISRPTSIALATDGTFYINDGNRVRRIAPDGTIDTYAGTGQNGFSGDGGPATAASFRTVAGLAISESGNLYIADSSNNRVRMVSSDGVISTITGTGLNNAFGDGGAADAASVPQPRTVDIGPDGSIYIVHRGSVVRVINPEGIIRTIVGNFRLDSLGNGVGDNCVNGIGPRINAEPSTGILLCNAAGAAIDPDGKLLVANVSRNQIIRVERLLPGFSLDETLIASSDGRQLFAFDAGGRHFKTLDTFTGTIIHQMQYDEEKRLAAVVDRHGNQTQIVRDGDEMTSRVISPYGQQTELVTNADGYLEQVSNPANESHRFAYNPGGLISEFTNPRDQTSQISYHPDGRLKLDANSGGGFLQLDKSDTENGYSVEMVSAEGRLRRHQVSDLADGNRQLSTTAPDGTETVEVQESSGISSTNSADGMVATTTVVPDPRLGLQAPVATRVEATPSGLKLTRTRTRTATLTDSQDLFSHSKLEEITNLNNRIFRNTYTASNRTFVSRSPEGRTIAQTANELGRQVSSQVANFLPSEFSYDARGRLREVGTGAGDERRTSAYDYFQVGPSAGFLQSITDGEGRTTAFEYDPAGRVTRQTLPDGRFVRFDYDPNGNLISLVPPGRDAHVFRYSAVDLEEAYTPPEVADTGTLFTTYEYDLDKELELVTRPDGQTIDYQYLAPGKKLSAVVTPTGTYSYAYDSVSGQLRTLTAPGSQTLTYSYDGALLQTEVAGGTVTGEVRWTHDDNFRIVSEVVNGQAISFAYDRDDLFLGAGDMTIVRSAANGLVEATNLGSVATSHEYNAFGELALDAAIVSGEERYSAAYPVRDRVGRIKEKIETIEGEIRTFEYDYDPVGRLEVVRVDGSISSQYAYDANGNRIAHNGTAATYDGQDRLLSYGEATYTYTPNGERLTKTDTSGITRYDYDVLGNLREVEIPDGQIIEYVIDGRNRRVGKKVNGTLQQGFLYGNQLEPVAELDADGNVVSRFVYASKAHSPDYMVKSGTTYRIISDHLGSPRLIVNVADGSIAQRMDFDEFGNLTNDTNPGFQPFGFAGGLYDRGTGLTRFGARDYDPEVGRWTGKDPIMFRGRDSNLYAYSVGDPINFFDPTGEIIAPLVPAIILGAGATIAGVVALIDAWNDFLNEAERLGDENERVNDSLRDGLNGGNLSDLADRLADRNRQFQDAAQAGAECGNAAAGVLYNPPVRTPVRVR